MVRVARGVQATASDLKKLDCLIGGQRADGENQPAVLTNGVPLVAGDSASLGIPPLTEVGAGQQPLNRELRTCRRERDAIYGVPPRIRGVVDPEQHPACVPIPDAPGAQVAPRCSDANLSAARQVCPNRLVVSVGQRLALQIPFRCFLAGSVQKGATNQPQKEFDIRMCLGEVVRMYWAVANPAS